MIGIAVIFPLLPLPTLFASLITTVHSARYV